jgi:N-acetyltransferase B complex (NatB) non catalytic subunit
LASQVRVVYIEHIFELILSYADKFGSSLCCYEDIFTYLSFVPTKSELCLKLQKLISPLDSAEDKIGQTRKNVTVRKILRYFNNNLSAEVTRKQVKALVDSYHEALPLGILRLIKAQN